MKNNFKFYLKVFWQMLKSEFIVINKNVINEIIDVLIWVSFSAFVFSYIFPQLGMSKDFGALVLVGAIVSLNLFDIWGTATNIHSDIEGNRTLTYFFTLPIPSWTYFLQKAFAQTYKVSIMSLFIIPTGKIILQDRLDLSNFSFLKYFLMFVTINICFGLFAIFMVSIVANLKRINSVWVRVLFPLWFLGGAEFPWVKTVEVSKKLAYTLLANPILYGMEGIRAAALGQQQYLNYWICLGVLWIFGITFGAFGIKKMLKRLDTV